MRECCLAIGVGFALLIAGCAKPVAKVPAGPAVETISVTEPVAAEPAVAAPAKPPFELLQKNWDETLQLVAAQTGKVVVLDAWSTSCDPCLREFPHLAKLQAEFPRDVVCISLSLDYFGGKKRPVSSFVEPVTEFIRQYHVPEMRHLLCTQPADDVFPLLEVPSIPAVLVFDRGGKLRKRFSDETAPDFTYDKQIRPFVVEVLKETADK